MSPSLQNGNLNGFLTNFGFVKGLMGINMIKYCISECIRRLVQMLFGNELFDFPILSSVRNVVYRFIFKTGKSPTVGAHMRFFRSHKMNSGKLDIGNYVLLAKEAIIDCSGSVTIEDYVWISERVQIYTHIHKLTENRMYGKDIESSDITIKRGSWIGAGAIILPSVRCIGENTVIGAGSVVTKDVPDNTVVAGNPAKAIKVLNFTE